MSTFTKEEELDMMFQSACNQIEAFYPKFMILEIFVNDDESSGLKDKYKQAIEEHYDKIINNPSHVDAGFDIYFPEGCTFSKQMNNKVDYKIICAANMVSFNAGQRHNNNCSSACEECFYSIEYNTGYYMYPRSSISNSPIRLANNVGIIDSGYRGNLQGRFDSFDTTFKANKFDRYIQICAPGLVPIVPVLVDTKEELGDETERGGGGFGSTGV